MHIDQSDFHDQLVRGLTHKMNNILSLFHGYIGLLMDDKKLDASTVANLARIKEAAHAASELMDRTKSLARPSSIIWREVDMEEFLGLLKPTLESFASRNIRLQINLPEKLLHIWADTTRLKTAVIEVVRNACEASPADGVVKIDVSAECHLSTRPSAAGKAVQPITWISINVTDHGHGIPQELSKKIFQPFFSTRDKQNSTGLGLTVTLGLLQQLGGAIRFTSKPGLTTFRLLLPSRAERTCGTTARL